MSTALESGDEALEPSLDAAFAAIARRVIPGATSVQHRRLAGGVSANVHALEVASAAGVQGLVVRRHGAAGWKRLPDDVTRAEFELLGALHGAGLPVPRPLLLDVSGAVLPSPFFVMERVEASTDRGDVSLDSAVREMAQFLARLHALDPGALRLPGLPAREDPVQGALEYLPAGGEAIPLREAVAAYRVQAPRASLLHGDFWPGNVLWAEGRLAAVVDWEDAAIGPAASDVACCRAELNALFGEAAARSFTSCYAALAAEGLPDLALWDVYVGAAALATLSSWGLPPDVEARRRERTSAFVARAAQELLPAR